MTFADDFYRMFGKSASPSKTQQCKSDLAVPWDAFEPVVKLRHVPNKRTASEIKTGFEKLKGVPM